jgi:zinc/manganese transport system substrate-binding protein
MEGLMRKNRIFIALLLLAFTCLTASPLQAAEKIKVVASFSIIGDLVHQVGGERVEVVTLIGPNSDAHAFQPSPSDAKALLGAKLIVINGLGLEGWADRFIKSAGYKGARLVASRGVKALEAEEDHGHEHGKGKKHAHGRYDPHAWQEVANVKVYVANIRDALIALDPEGKAEYEKRTADYQQKLDALDAEIRTAFAGIPKAERRVITSHDAFHYYGDTYGIELLAPQGVSGDAEPSARAVARLIRQIRQEGIKAIFVENITNPRLIERIAKETGAVVGGTVYSDALSEPSGPAATYLAMMRHNTRLLSAALKR